jgi:hypothetical protein
MAAAVKSLLMAVERLGAAEYAEYADSSRRYTQIPQIPGFDRGPDRRSGLAG